MNANRIISNKFDDFIFQFRFTFSDFIFFFVHLNECDRSHDFYSDIVIFAMQMSTVWMSCVEKKELRRILCV